MEALLKTDIAGIRLEMTDLKPEVAGFKSELKPVKWMFATPAFILPLVAKTFL